MMMIMLCPPSWAQALVASCAGHTSTSGVPRDFIPLIDCLGPRPLPPTDLSPVAQVAELTIIPKTTAILFEGIVSAWPALSKLVQVQLHLLLFSFLRALCPEKALLHQVWTCLLLPERHHRRAVRKDVVRDVEVHESVLQLDLHGLAKGHHGCYTSKRTDVRQEAVFADLWAARPY